MSHRSPYSSLTLAPRDLRMLHGKLAGLSGLGALERQNPLPVGRYWQDFFGDNRFKIQQWLAANSKTIFAEATQSFEENSGGPARDFYVFKVLAPTSWDAVTFGFPTVAASNVTSSDDTVQKPPPEKSGTDTVSDAASSIAKYAGYGVLAIGALLAFRALDTLGLLTRGK